MARAGRRATAEDGDAPGASETGAGFRERALAGEYEALRAAGLARTVAAGEGPGLREEIAMVRVALARLMEEETDASAFAAGVARLVSVAVQAARVERVERGRFAAGAPEEVAALEALLRRLAEEGERA